MEKLLPKSPRKKSEVIKGLASKYKLRIQFNNKKRGRTEKVINDEQTAYLDEFFERPDITYINPGRKDHVYLGKVDGEKTYAQKRYLLWTLRELFEILNGEEKNPYKFTFKQMYKYIKTKKQLILQGNIPDTSCLCEVCENSCLIAKALRGFKKGHPTDAHFIMEKYCCDPSTQACIESTCEKCNVMAILNDWESDESEESSSEEDETPSTFTYKAWIRENNKIQKTTVTKNSLDELYHDWEISVLALKKHIYRKREQVIIINLFNMKSWLASSFILLLITVLIF